MYIVVAFLSILSRLPSQVASIGTCVPNTHFTLNGLLCYCDSLGQWSDKNCTEVRRQHNCLAGQITWQGCTRCICEENGQFTCNRSGCLEDQITPSPQKQLNKLVAVGLWCIPFRSYYVECNICACPASGRTDMASCAQDSSCVFQRRPTTEMIESGKETCIPNVMYLFLCLQCLCTDKGFFAQEKCIDRCPNPKIIEETTQQCSPKTFFKNDCNVCYCSDDGVPDKSICTKNNCTNATKYQSLDEIINNRDCVPHSFTSMRCVYCECKSEGTVFENACLERECLNTTSIDYGILRETCSPGELLPICTECFCPDIGVTNRTFCTKSCSYQNELTLLETVLSETQLDPNFINRKTLQELTTEDNCDAKSVYALQGNFCLCPDSGKKEIKLCVPVLEHTSIPNSTKTIGRTTSDHQSTLMDVNRKCEPNSYVEFECNLCICSREGSIDPKWCTYDDCHLKRNVQQSHISSKFQFSTAGIQVDGTCEPGTISKVDCNFCICSETGLLKDRTCTKNQCSTNVNQPTNAQLMSCDPLAYYEIDCNVCYCPRDGLKNIAKCSKNVCEKNFLRSEFEVCEPGHLFSDECNVCICPPNGEKHDKACTNFTCPDASAAWKKIFKVPLGLLDHPLDDTTKFLDVCFPGEEFTVGCKVCVCPEVGLRTYATCTHKLCDENEEELLDDTRNVSPFINTNGLPKKHLVYIDTSIPQNNEHYADFRNLEHGSHLRTRRNNRIKETRTDIVIAEIVGAGRRTENCQTVNVPYEDKKECTVGSMYIISCQECICPYMGSIMNYCRPLPANIYCEEPMQGRRLEQLENSTTSQNDTNTSNQTTNNAKQTAIFINQTSSMSSSNFNHAGQPNITQRKHTHTKYHCEVPGRVMDGCFICECEDELAIIEEHCFQGDHKDCDDRRPSFLDDSNKIVYSTYF